MKTYSTSTRNAYYADNFIAIDLLEIHLDDALYLTNAHWNIQVETTTAPDSGVNTYEAQGDFISYSTVSEDFDVRVGKFGVVLSALGTSFVDKFIDFTEQQKLDIEGKRVTIHKCFLDPAAGFDIIDDPIIIFDGIIYNVSAVETEATATLRLECSTLFADFERIAGRKTSIGSNALFLGYDTDKCFEKTGFVGTEELKWGKA